MAKIIEVEVDTDGSVQVKAVGYPGSSCKAATRPLESALGIVQDVTLTSEYYQTAVLNPVKRTQ